MEFIYTDNVGDKYEILQLVSLDAADCASIADGKLTHLVIDEVIDISCSYRDWIEDYGRMFFYVRTGNSCQHLKLDDGKLILLNEFGRVTKNVKARGVVNGLVPLMAHYQSKYDERKGLFEVDLFDPCVLSPCLKTEQFKIRDAHYCFGDTRVVNPPKFYRSCEITVSNPFAAAKATRFAAALSKLLR